MNGNLLPILSPPQPEAILAVLLPKLRSFLGRRISNHDVEYLAQEIMLRVHEGARRLSDETRNQFMDLADRAQCADRLLSRAER